MRIKPFRLFFVLVFSLFLIVLFASASYDVKVDGKVVSALKADDNVRVIVVLKEKPLGGKMGPLKAASVPEGLKIKNKFSGGFSGTVNNAGLKRLKSNSDIEGVYLDEVSHILLDGSVPLVNATMDWPLVYNGSNLTGAGESVCVIDTGVNYSHPSMGNCSSAAFLNGSCDKVPSGYDFANNDNDPADDHSHGTHVAGIIASTSSAYRGVAPDARIIALKACNSGGSCSNSDILSSIDWCVNNYSSFNISVISISLGGSPDYSDYCDDSYPYYRNSINSAVAKNISVIIAAGNDGSSSKISDPACINNATAVGSSTKSDAISSFSNRNNITELLAPGTGITSLDYQGTTVSMSGTSMATPHVSGAFALLSGYKRRISNNTVSPSLIQSALNKTGVRINDSGGNGVSYSRISVYDAFLYFSSSLPNISFINSTPSNNSAVSASKLVVNASSVSDEHYNIQSIFGAFLEWNNTINYSMSRFSGTVFYIEFSNFTNGNATYRVFANNSVGSFGISPVFYVQMNNSAPNITSFFPLPHVSISEPSNQSFNITYVEPENESITITWLVNGSNQSSFFNLSAFNFTGNYSTAGSYNITVIVSDGNAANFTNWTFQVNNTNTAPLWNFTPLNMTLLEDSSAVFNITAYDNDGDALVYFINDSRLTINSSNGSINYTPSLNYFGEIFLNVTASDSLLNLSEIIFLNFTPVNDAPSIALSNVSVNATDWLNITVSASDVDNEFFNYTINYSGFSQLSSGNFSWKTNISSYATYSLNVSVTDGILTSFILINATVVFRADTDLDGVPDIYDTDSDNDGITDSDDYLIGNNYSFLNLSGTLVGEQLNITINSTSNLSRIFNDTLLINITNASVSLLQFHWNFSNSSLYLNFTLNDGPENSSYGAILVRGLVLQQNTTKNISLRAVNSTISSVCIKDADVSSVNNISYSCNAVNESLISCPGSNSNYSCSLVNDTYNRTYFTISGLRYSAVKQQCADADADGFYVSGCGNGTDCDDSRSGINPSASESCGDGLDNNCNGQADEGCSSSSSSSSGGGGGGGGGGGSVKLSPKVSFFFGLVEPGKVKSMKLSNPSIAFTNITFSSRVILKSFSISVEPENVSKDKALNDSYQYLKVTVQNQPDERELDVVGIYFSVNKTWLSSYDKDSVLLKRYNYGLWQSLQTLRVNETAHTFGYFAESPGFSLFAVSVKPIVPASNISVSNETVRKNLSGNMSSISGSAVYIPAVNESPSIITEQKQEEKPLFKFPQLEPPLVLAYFLVPFLALFVIIAVFFAVSKPKKEDGDEQMKEIEEHVEKSLAYGHSKTQARASLIDAGFSPELVDKALRKY